MINKLISFFSRRKQERGPTFRDMHLTIVSLLKENRNIRAENSKSKSLIGELLDYAESLEGRLDSHDLDMLEDTDLKSRARAALKGLTEKSGAGNG